MEQTLVIIKPDALKNSLTGYILSQFSESHTGLVFAGAKVVNASDMIITEHYKKHIGAPYFKDLVNYMTGLEHYPNDEWKRRVIVLLYHGKDAIKVIREIAGPTNPHNAREINPGSIRSLGTYTRFKDEQGNFMGDRMENLVHTSSNPEQAEYEIKLWFKPYEIPELMRLFPTVVSCEHIYYSEGKLMDKYVSGAVLIVAPGEIVWETDYNTLLASRNGLITQNNVKSVVAKYINCA